MTQKRRGNETNTFYDIEKYILQIEKYILQFAVKVKRKGFFWRYKSQCGELDLAW